MGRDVMEFSEAELERFEAECFGASFSRGAASMPPPPLWKPSDPAKFYGGLPRPFDGDETFEPVTD